MNTTRSLHSPGKCGRTYDEHSYSETAYKTHEVPADGATKADRF